MSHKKWYSAVDGVTLECMDEIGNNAISTDASSQIDILLNVALSNINLNTYLRKVETETDVLEANREKNATVNATLLPVPENKNFSAQELILNWKEDSNEFCSLVGNDNKMGADVKGKPFVRF